MLKDVCSLQTTSLICGIYYKINTKKGGKGFSVERCVMSKFNCFGKIDSKTDAIRLVHIVPKHANCLNVRIETRE